MQFYNKILRLARTYEWLLPFGESAKIFTATFSFTLSNVNDNVHNGRDTGYPMKFSRLLFHRIQSYGISIGYYWGMEMCQAIGSCYLNGLEWSAQLTCPIYVLRSPFNLTDILFHPVTIHDKHKCKENDIND